MRALLLFPLVAACTVHRPVERPVGVDPSTVDRACAERLRQRGERLGDAALTACAHDFDCREVSPLVAGRCGAVVNTDAFSAVRDEFARSPECDDVTLVVPSCPRARPVCVQGRCASEPAAEIEDECLEQGKALDAARRAANTCDRDEACVALDDTRATNVDFLASAAGLREAKARACGDVPPPLFVALDEPVLAFCVADHCQTERQFTTTVRHRERAVTFELTMRARTCLMDALRDSVTELPPRYLVTFRTTIDRAGRLNEFEFPQRPPAAVQAAIAARLHDCNVGVVSWRGKPVSVRWTFHLMQNDD